MKTFAVLLLIFCVNAMAQAHRVNINARLDGNIIVGSVYFTGGGVAENIDVDVLTLDGAKLPSVKTNAKGEFLFLPTSKDTQYTFTVDTGDGHAAKTTVSVGGNPIAPGTAKTGMRTAAASAAGSPPAAAAYAAQSGAMQISIDPEVISAAISPEISKQLSKQIGPVIDKLDKQAARVQFANVVGGIGFAFGIAGIAAIIWTRRLVLADIIARGAAAKDSKK